MRKRLKAVALSRFTEENALCYMEIAWTAMGGRDIFHQRLT